MDTLNNIQQEALQLCSLPLAEYGDRERGSCKFSDFKESPIEKRPFLLRLANDKKNKNASADFVIRSRDIKNLGISQEKLQVEYPKPKLQGDSFVQDFETNDAETEFFIKLKKASCMNSAIKEILTARRGKRNDKGTSKTTLIFPKIYKAGELDGQGSFSYARLLAISVHMKKVLEKAGETCHIMIDQMHKNFCQAYHELVQEATLGKDLNSKPRGETRRFLQTAYVEKAVSCKYNKICSGKDSAHEVRVDVEKYLANNDLEQGKDGFDKNLKAAVVVQANGEVSNCIKTASEVEEFTDNIISNVDDKVSLISVSQAQHSWEAQSACICWKMLSDRSRSIENVALCCCGPCLPKFASETSCGGDIESMTFQDYFRSKSIEIRKSYVSRYGPEVQGEDWEKVISDVSSACIKFDLLSSPLRNKVYLNVSSDDNDSNSSRDSIFVLYNYSRLATLLDKYDRDQKSGAYPPLPSIDEVDFSHLREEQEWRIFVKYMLSYPILVSDVARPLKDRFTYQINPSINKESVEGEFFLFDSCHCSIDRSLNRRWYFITCFLASMARDLSSYYHQTKVLLDPMPHLFHLMFARIYFIKAAKEVMQDAFDLIGIKPPTQM